MTRYDLSDGIHPNKIGYDKMASVWFKAVMASSRVRRVSLHGLRTSPNHSSRTS
jgi:hypothetical protein